MVESICLHFIYYWSHRFWSKDPIRDGFVPPEEDEHEGDTSPFTSCELQTDDSHSFPPEHSGSAVLVSPSMSSGDGSTGWRIKRTMWESSMSSLVVAHCHGSHRRGRSCYSSYFFLPSTKEPHLVAFSKVTADIGLTVDSATIVELCFKKSFIAHVTKWKWN